MDTIQTKQYWVALNMVPGVGAKTFRKLVTMFGTPEHVFSASIHQIRAIPGMPEKTAQNISTFGFPDQVKRELEQIEKHKIHLVTYEDKNYPALLKNIFDAPPVLYVRGMPLREHAVMLAVVGSRRASIYGRHVAKTLCRELALKGVTIVSGMARGIDSEAHRGTLQGGGYTVAVLGCGVNIIYPPENDSLYHAILEQGTLVSEFPLYTKPNRKNFPARNRIISGLSLGTLVVEAGIRSGALITADTALEQGRDVFAVPGNITSPASKGTNRLLKQGAILIEQADDIFNALPLEISREIGENRQTELPLDIQPRQLPTLTKAEQQILSYFEERSLHIDDLIIRSQLPSSTVSALLMMLEMKDVIRQTAGKMFLRI